MGSKYPFKDTAWHFCIEAEETTGDWQSTSDLRQCHICKLKRREQRREKELKQQLRCEQEWREQHGGQGRQRRQEERPEMQRGGQWMVEYQSTTRSTQTHSKVEHQSTTRSTQTHSKQRQEQECQEQLRHGQELRKQQEPEHKLRESQRFEQELRECQRHGQKPRERQRWEQELHRQSNELREQLEHPRLHRRAQVQQLQQEQHEQLRHQHHRKQQREQLRHQQEWPTEGAEQQQRLTQEHHEQRTGSGKQKKSLRQMKVLRHPMNQDQEHQEQLRYESEQLHIGAQGLSEELRQREELIEQQKCEQDLNERQREVQEWEEQLIRGQDWEEQLLLGQVWEEQLMQEQTWEQHLRQHQEWEKHVRQQELDEQLRRGQDWEEQLRRVQKWDEQQEQQLLVGQMFDVLLSEFDVIESEDVKVQNLEKRMKVLQNELMIQYFGGDHLPYSSLLALDQTIGSEDLTLIEQLNVVKAMLQLTVDSDDDDDDDDDGFSQLSLGRECDFLLSLLTYLLKENSDLAEKIFYRFTASESPLTSESSVILGHILFNNIWTPTEIITFLQNTTKSPRDQVTAILETVLTYRLSYDSAVSAINEAKPVYYLHLQAGKETDKDIDTLISEMREAKYPKDMLTIIENVLRYVESELLKVSDKTRLSKDQICEVKSMICSMDFHNPDIACLWKICVSMSLAVRECRTRRHGWNTGGLWHPDVEVQGYFPRLTQLASVLLLLLPRARGEKGCLLEIATGEGKTCILAMFTAIQAIRGLKPDIVTSSPVLAVRDHKEWCAFYSMFGLTSAVLRNHENAYEKDIVYGTVVDFAADILRQEFDDKKTRRTRKFDMVIVDEVDHMTLDNGDSTTYLSDDDSGLMHMEQVLAGIWAMVSACRQIEMQETGEIHWITAPQLFYKTAISALGVSESEDFSTVDILQLGVKLGFYSQNEIDELVQAEHNMGDEDANQDFRDAKWKALENIMIKIGPDQQYEVLREFANEVGKGDSIEYFSVVDNKAAVYEDIVCPNFSKDEVRLLLLDKGCACQIIPENDLISWTVDNVKSKIKYSDQCDPKNIDKFRDFIVIPAFLKEYTEQHLRLFIQKALTAIVMVEGREYMIEKSCEGDKKQEGDRDIHQYDAIIPVDMSNGVLEKSRSWLEGLQQFLEMKHQLAISPLTTMTNYMSNIHYFQRYLAGEGVFGVTGTLGGDAEKGFLYRHYETKSYVMPTHRRKKVIEIPAVQVPEGKELWIQKICETAWKVADRGQVVLVVCEDINTANELHSAMKTQEKHPIIMYTISGKHKIEQQAFSGGDIIIATNLAGRGTDIQVQLEVNRCGGLFVLLTYFPNSQRVEKQVFGRTARKGNPGMVHMILNQEQLQPAYQGQSVDVMRQLREERELHHIHYMEGDELRVIDFKRELFSTFCGFLDDFRKKYTHTERLSCHDMNIDDVPECFKSYRNKFDYHPAVSALKQSWALWLNQHKKSIRGAKVDEDIYELMQDLRGQLEHRSDSLLRGKSTNLHDYIKQAASRTDLHLLNKKVSYGAKAYWQCTAECDQFYSAIALYNKAYVAINLREDGYKAEAEQLLKEAQGLVDVFLMETTNTMIFCNLSRQNSFRSHHENANFLTQMQVRMNIFQFWKNDIENALGMLTQVLAKGEDAITEESSVSRLLAETDFITENELEKMHQYGLKIVFTIKKKPQFSYQALICVFIGVLQVVAGALVLAFTSGAATNFGLGLISEGVSDMISGIIGMVTGNFSWSEWAVSKSISIGISLVCGGINVLSKGLTSARIGAKAIASGAKSATSIVVKQAAKQAAKYAIQELGKQGVLAAVNYAMDKGFKAAFKKIFRTAFKNKVSSLLRANRGLDEALTHLICQEIPKEVIQTRPDEFTIDPQCEKRLEESVTHMSTQVIPELVTDLTNVRTVISVLSQVSHSALRVLERQKASGVLLTVSRVLLAAEYTTSVIEMVKAIPTEGIINDQLVPQLLTQMDNQKDEQYVSDGRQELEDVKRLKQKFIHTIANSVSEALVDAFVAHITSIASRTTGSMVNHKIGRCVENVLGRHTTKPFFDEQKKNHKMRMACQAPAKSLSTNEKSELSHYAKSLSSSERPATGLDLHILTKSDMLNGKGIRIIITDEHGKPLSEEHYQGKDKSAGDVTLRLVKEKDTSQQRKGVLPSLSRRIRGEHQPYSGHFEVLNADGTFSQVLSDGQNCLFHAVAQATSHGRKDVNDLRRDASKLRSEVHQEIQQNISNYAPLLKLQRGYEESCRNPGLFTISGGTRQTRREGRRNFMEAINSSPLTNEQREEYKNLHLGLVGEHGDLTGRNQQPGNNQHIREADHIPPIACYKEVSGILASNPQLSEELQKNNPKLFEELNKSKYFLLCMKVRKEHHRQALTTGYSTESQICRNEMSQALSKGDVEKTLKMSFITAHPETSQSLRQDAGIQRQTPHNTQPRVHSADYYQVGYRLMIDKYYDKGLIDGTVKDRLNSWVNSGAYRSRNTQEYKSLKTAISRP
ncbi:uncharacterized protein LOC143100067 isoform X1 [Alosa pseudoharengus]|uniref:uncharacterized protein LOC143100067 isoform X1 n=1 Tax=Alosa pseudoharengus TaxID=34774 RepID=UPI003F8B5D4E